MRTYSIIFKPEDENTYLRQDNPLANARNLISKEAYVIHEAMYIESATLLLNPNEDQGFYNEHDLVLIWQFRNDPEIPWVECSEPNYIGTTPDMYRQVFKVRNVKAAIIKTFQQRVRIWIERIFGPSIADNIPERSRRFLEEALELVQATGMNKDEVIRLVVYTYGREIGETSQELGGVMVTIAGLAESLGLNMTHCAETELSRIQVNMEEIRLKQQAKISAGVAE